MDGKHHLLRYLLISSLSVWMHPLLAQTSIPVMEHGHHYELMNHFYNVRQKNPHLAEKTLRHLLAENPDNVIALKEMGYLLLNQKRYAEALPYFQHASYLQPTDYHLHQQLGYLYNQLNQNRSAYYEFDQAAASPDPKIQQQSHEAMINLAGAQTQVLPDPFFADIYLEFDYLSRFHDFIFPWQGRAGVEYGDYDQFKLYALYLGNYDNQSGSRLGEVPIIYFDNYSMFGGGAEYRPWQELPLYGFIEYGKTYEVYLIEEDQHWQNDFRVGAYTYFQWGENFAYKPELTKGFDQIGDFYGYFTYYSRYDHDWIGQFRIREGIRALQYHYSAVDVYLKGEFFVDTQEIYYNNIIQGGPGIAFTPDSRWPVQFRIEGMRGMYIPTPDSDENPYEQFYNTLLAELTIYLSF